MDLKLSTADGEEVNVQPVELPEDVASGRDTFLRAQASDPVADDKMRPPRRAPRAETEEDKPRRGRPPKDAAARTAKAAPKPARVQTDAQRKEGVKGLVQVASVLCLAMDQRTPAADVSFRADAYTLAANADAIADAVAETAKQSEGFARALDKITAAGPYAALVGVAFSVGMQLASNHGVTVARTLGAADPRDVVAAFEAA